MTSSGKIISSLFALVVVLNVVKCKDFYIKSDILSEQCTYSGYKPGGEEPNIQHVKSKAAQIQESTLQSVMGHFNNGAGVTAATLGLMNSAGKLLTSAPHVAAALGALSVAMGFIVSSPGPQDILDKANEAIQDLADDVNDRLDKMKDYVDFRVIELEKNLLSSEYTSLFHKWVHCAEERTKEDGNNCQMNVERELKSDRFKFQRLHNKQDDYNPNGQYRKFYTWQFLKEKAAKYPVPSHYEVKELEAALIPFRNFASLHLMVLQTLVSTYREIKGEVACKHYKHYLESVRDRSRDYISYVKWAYEWIYIRNYEENLWSEVRGRNSGSIPFFIQSGGYPPTLKCGRNHKIYEGGKHTATTKQCSIQCIQMYDDNTCTFKDTIRADGKSVGYPYKRKSLDAGSVAMAIYRNTEAHEHKICPSYLSSLKNDLINYWTKEVLDVTKEWEMYGENAKQALAKITGC